MSLRLSLACLLGLALRVAADLWVATPGVLDGLELRTSPATFLSEPNPEHAPRRGRSLGATCVVHALNITTVLSQAEVEVLAVEGPECLRCRRIANGAVLLVEDFPRLTGWLPSDWYFLFMHIGASAVLGPVSPVSPGFGYNAWQWSLDARANHKDARESDMLLIDIGQGTQRGDYRRLVDAARSRNEHAPEDSPPGSRRDGGTTASTDSRGLLVYVAMYPNRWELVRKSGWYVYSMRVVLAGLAALVAMYAFGVLKHTPRPWNQLHTAMLCGEASRILPFSPVLVGSLLACWHVCAWRSPWEQL